MIQAEPVAVGHYVAVFARADSALRDSADAIFRDRMRDGSLEKTFRDWKVWDPSQARHFARVLGSQASVPSSGRPSSELTVVTSGNDPRMFRIFGVIFAASSY